MNTAADCVYVLKQHAYGAAWWSQSDHGPASDVYKRQQLSTDVVMQRRPKGLGTDKTVEAT